jgi:hypothetical protein
MGGRIGYSAATGIRVILMAWFGVISLMMAAIPVVAILPFLLYIGLLICSQAFQETPGRHTPAIILARTPRFAAWCKLQIDNSLGAAGVTVTPSLIDKMAQTGVMYHGLGSNGRWLDSRRPDPPQYLSLHHRSRFQKGRCVRRGRRNPDVFWLYARTGDRRQSDTVSQLPTFWRPDDLVVRLRQFRRAFLFANWNMSAPMRKKSTFPSLKVSTQRNRTRWHFVHEVRLSSSSNSRILRRYSCFTCASRTGPASPTRAVTNLIFSGTLERCRDIRIIVPHNGGALAERITRLAAHSRWSPLIKGTRCLTVPAILRHRCRRLESHALVVAADFRLFAYCLWERLAMGFRFGGTEYQPAAQIERSSLAPKIANTSTRAMQSSS